MTKPSHFHIRSSRPSAPLSGTLAALPDEEIAPISAPLGSRKPAFEAPKGIIAKIGSLGGVFKSKWHTPQPKKPESARAVSPTSYFL